MIGVIFVCYVMSWGEEVVMMGGIDVRYAISCQKGLQLKYIMSIGTVLGVYIIRGYSRCVTYCYPLYWESIISLDTVVKG